MGTFIHGRYIYALIQSSSCIVLKPQLQECSGPPGNAHLQHATFSLAHSPVLILKFRQDVFGFGLTVELNGHGHFGQKWSVDPDDAFWHVRLPGRKDQNTVKGGLRNRTQEMKIRDIQKRKHVCMTMTQPEQNMPSCFARRLMIHLPLAIYSLYTYASLSWHHREENMDSDK